MREDDLDVAIRGTLSDERWSGKHSHVCPDAGSEMRELARHAYGLGDLVCHAAFNFTELASCTELGDVLKIIGGIHEVTIDCARFDTSIYMCGGAAGYEEEHSELVSVFATQLVRLLLLFNAFENACEVVGVPRSREGVGVDAARFLANHIQHLPKHAECVVGRLFCTIKRWLSNDQATLHRWESTDPQLRGFLLALVVVARLRNRLTHQLLDFPEVDDTAERLQNDVLVTAGWAGSGFMDTLIGHSHRLGRKVNHGRAAAEVSA